MHRYRLEHRISHADVDLLGELKVSALLGLLEQAAVEASTDAGFDPAWYTRAGRVWIIRRTRLERALPVGGGDTVAVETHVEDWRRARSLRRYEVRLVAPGRGLRARDVAPTAAEAIGEAGAPRAERAERLPLVARATTDWVYCDMATGRPLSVPESVRRAFSGDGAGHTRPRAAALADAGDGAPVEMCLTVRASHLDHVTHVNNAAYAGFLEDGAFELFAVRGYGVERMLGLGGALRIRSLDLEYLVDAVAGDDLVVRSWLLSTKGSAAPDAALQPFAGPPRETHFLQAIDRAAGTRLMRAESLWVWRARPLVLGGVPEPDGA